MSKYTDAFDDKYDEPGGIAWGKEILTTRQLCMQAGRWGTQADVQDAQAEHHLTKLLAAMRRRRFV